jgi:N-acetylglucosamine-6-phosphate deacetylase
MTRLLLTNARLFDPEERAPREGALLLQEGRIAGRPGAEEVGAIDAERVDLAGAGVAPGLLDLHFHGALPFANVHDAVSCLERASTSLARHGTTGFLATTVALPGPELVGHIRALAPRVAGGGWPGADPMGIHLEGPWIAAGAAGAQPAAALRPADPREVEVIIAQGAGTIRMVTLAPELPGTGALLAALSRARIVAAMGHSLANPQEIAAALDAGLCHVTHLFNAMGPLHHRELGVAGVALTEDRLSCDLICDGAHVHPTIVRLAARAKGERLILITDQIDPPASSAPSFGSGPIHDDGKTFRLQDGRLAGSRLFLDQALENAQKFGALSLHEAIAAATLRPARLLGIEAERGTLRAGARADLFVFGPDAKVRETWVLGRCVHAVV